MAFLRQLVSKKKLRFQQDGFDLDLSYVTPKLIAMGFPSENIEGIYRNNMKDVKRFFLHYHDGHYKVYNLCSERSYSSNHFKNATASFPFDDHNPCSFQMLVTFCEDAHEYLTSHDKNIIAVHCKAGKGRTGLVLCCYLQFSKHSASPTEALDYYAQARTKNKKGVTIPSQRRWVFYFGEYLHKYRFANPPVEFPFDGVNIRITGFVLRGWAAFNQQGDCAPYAKVARMNKSLMYSGKLEKKAEEDLRRWTKDQREFAISCNIKPCRGELHIVFYDESSRSDEKMFGFWIHTSLLPFPQRVNDHDPFELILTKTELDKACKDKKHKLFSEDFSITIFYQLNDENDNEDDEGVDDHDDGNDDGGGGDHDDEQGGTKGKNFNPIRHLVSKKKLRYQKDGFDLDLSYITPNIIAMGFPSVSLEGMYRNKMADVQKFFKHYHQAHYKVFNLCSERTYTPDHFENRTASYPFDDHNPCPFKMLVSFCEDADKFLESSEKNCVAIHCKAGKGRTGLMIGALLMQINLCSTAQEALAVYGKARTSNVKGVTIPSQRRYVQYFEEYLYNFKQLDRPFPFKGDPIQLVGFYLAPIITFNYGGGCVPYFKVSLADHSVIYNSLKQGPMETGPWKKPQIDFGFQCKVAVQGDIHVVFYDHDALGDTKMFGFWFHTAFIHSKSIVIKKEDLDTACKDSKAAIFAKNFQIEIFFADVLPKPAGVRRPTHQPGEKKAVPRGSVINQNRKLLSPYVKAVKLKASHDDGEIDYIVEEGEESGEEGGGGEAVEEDGEQPGREGQGGGGEDNNNGHSIGKSTNHMKTISNSLAMSTTAASVANQHQSYNSLSNIGGSGTASPRHGGNNNDNDSSNGNSDNTQLTGISENNDNKNSNNTKKVGGVGGAGGFVTRPPADSDIPPPPLTPPPDSDDDEEEDAEPPSSEELSDDEYLEGAPPPPPEDEAPEEDNVEPQGPQPARVEEERRDARSQTHLMSQHKPKPSSDSSSSSSSSSLAPPASNSRIRTHSEGRKQHLKSQTQDEFGSSHNAHSNGTHKSGSFFNNKKGHILLSTPTSTSSLNNAHHTYSSSVSNVQRDDDGNIEESNGKSNSPSSPSSSPSSAGSSAKRVSGIVITDEQRIATIATSLPHPSSLFGKRVSGVVSLEPSHSPAPSQKLSGDFERPSHQATMSGTGGNVPRVFGFSWLPLLITWNIAAKDALGIASKLSTAGYGEGDIDPEILSREALKEMDIGGAILGRMVKGIRAYYCNKNGLEMRNSLEDDGSLQNVQ